MNNSEWHPEYVSDVAWIKLIQLLDRWDREQRSGAPSPGHEPDRRKAVG